MRHLETIIVLVLLSFNFIPQRSHHSLTFTRSRLPDSATVTNPNAWGWHKLSKWSRRHNRSAYSPEWKNAPRCIGGTITGPITGTTDTTLTSLLLQPSTITCCDRFDRSCVNIDNTESPIPTEQSLYRIP